MKKKNSNTVKNKENIFASFLKNTGKYVKKNYAYLIVFILGFLAVSFINFCKVSTTESVASFIMDDFEIGQISDRTIVAEKTIPADQINPVTILKGEKIIKKGFPITEESYEKLAKMASSPVYVDPRAFANSEIFLLVVSIMWYLLLAFLPFGRKFRINEIILQVVFFLIVFACASLCGKFKAFSSPYSICIIIPASLCVILLSILYGQLVSVIFSFVAALGVLNGCGWELVPFLFVLSSCLVSCFIVRKIERRIDMIFVAIVVGLINAILLLLLGVIFNERLTNIGLVFFGVAMNGFASGLLTMGLLTPLELMLNTASVFRLMDLSDLNNSFMRNMLVQASGTYQHSMMVAQLSENACREIGANPLVARVGAYYHDIGKIENSEYFVENQRGENKHDEINPSLSVSIIRSHVKKGVEKARQLHMPQIIIDIIAEHHGNSVISYFYFEAKKEAESINNDKNNKKPSVLVTPEEYSYQGNPPSSRESAVVMLADTVEAACRTLENKSVPSLEKFITKLIQGKIDSKQLDNCNLTFNDLTKIKQAFIQILAGYYHSRIEYPEQENKPEGDATEEKAEEKAEAKPQVQKVEEKAEPKVSSRAKSETGKRVTPKEIPVLDTKGLKDKKKN